MRALFRQGSVPPIFQYARHIQVRRFNGTVGIVGVPNVGKSLLFNALNQSSIAKSANYPFCTIEPNIAKTVFHDPILHQMAKSEKSAKVIEGTIEIRDIAGLVKGANSGLGLGNAFLSHIRGASVLLHVVRCFQDDQVSRVEDLSPVEELQVVMDELILSDMDVVAKRVMALQKSANGAEMKKQLEVAENVLNYLENGQPGRLALNLDNRHLAKDLCAITTKPLCLVCNVDSDSAGSGNAMSREIIEAAKSVGAGATVVISAQLEDELVGMKGDETFVASYLTELGLEGSGIPKLLRSCLSLLELSYFYTVGPDESRAWFFRSPGSLAEASAAIHSSFPQLVTGAEMCRPEEILEAGGWTAAKNKGGYLFSLGRESDNILSSGKLKMVGRDRTMAEGSVVHFQLKKK